METLLTRHAPHPPQIPAGCVSMPHSPPAFPTHIPRPHSPPAFTNPLTRRYVLLGRTRWRSLSNGRRRGRRGRWRLECRAGWSSVAPLPRWLVRFSKLWAVVKAARVRWRARTIPALVSISDFSACASRVCNAFFVLSRFIENNLFVTRRCNRSVQALLYSTQL